MLTTGNVTAPIGHTRGLPVPAKPVPIRPVQRRNTSPFTTTAPTAPDPDAVARLERLGYVTVTPVTIDDKPMKVVTRRKTRKPQQARGTGTTRRTDLDTTTIAADYTAGATLAELAVKHRASEQTIRGRLRDAGIPMRATTRRVTVHTDTIVALFNQGHTMKEIANQVGLSDVTIGNRLRSVGIRVGRGHTATFDEDRALAMARDGATAYAIGKAVGVARRTILDRLATHGITFEPVNQQRADIPRLLQLGRDGKTITQIADLLEVSTRTVTTHLRRAGITPPDGRAANANAPRTDITPDMLAADYKAGLGINDLAKKHGASRATIARRLREVDDLQRRHVGGQNITPAPVRAAILTDYQAGMTASQVAEKHDVPAKTVEGIVRRAGIARRTGVEGAAGITDILAANGVTAADVRAWATAEGREVTARGLPSRHLVEDYLLQARNPGRRTA